MCRALPGFEYYDGLDRSATNAPQPTLARLGARTTSPALGLRQAPSPATIRPLALLGIA